MAITHKWVKGIEGNLMKVDDGASQPIDDTIEIVDAEQQVAEDKGGAKPAPDPHALTREEIQQRKIEAELVEALKRERDHLKADRAAAQEAAEAERRARASAETELQKRTGQAIRAYGHATYSEHQQIVNALQAVKMEREHAQRELRAALADDSLDPAEKAQRVADAQTRISEAAVDQRSLEQGEMTLRSKLEEAQTAIQSIDAERQPAQDRPPPAAQQPTPQEAMEAWIGGLPKLSREWIKEHREYAVDPKLNRRLIRFAEEWADDGKELHTAEFVVALNGKFFPKNDEREEKELPKAEDEGAGDVEVDVTPAPPKRPMPAAPVSRAAVPGTQASPSRNKVVLSAAERDTAIKLFGPGTRFNLNPEQAQIRYGRNKQQMERAGAYEDRR